VRPHPIKARAQPAASPDLSARGLELVLFFMGVME
jgi:hypothetical protein